MNMGIGFSEIALIVVLILLFFGSKELPKFIRETARFIAKIRRYGDKVKHELDEVTRSLDVPAFVQTDSAAAERKKELRKKFYAARKALTPEERAERSAVICRHLTGSAQFRRAGALLVYVNMGAEVETRALIREMLRTGKRVIAPYCKPDQRTMGMGEITDLENDITVGANKVPEPVAERRDRFYLSDLQLIVCPGVGFDRYGGRLGRGYAYYDNFLRELKGRVPIIALAFDCQVQSDQLPFSYSDVVMDQIITESGFKLPQPDIQEAQAEGNHAAAGGLAG